MTALFAPARRGGRAEKTRLNWASPDVLLAELPLVGSETILPTIDIPGVGQATLAPTCMPYSPEFLPRKPGRGDAALEGLAKATGGCERSEPAGDLEAGAAPAAERALVALPAALGRRYFPDRGPPRRTGVLSVDWRLFAHLQGAASWLRRRLVFKFAKRKAGAKAAPRGSSETDTDRAAADRPLQNKPEPSRRHRRQPRSRPLPQNPRPRRPPNRPSRRQKAWATHSAKPSSAPATHGKEIGALPRSRVSRPVGATDNSPAIYRWGKRKKTLPSRRDGRKFAHGHVFGRPYGTIVVPVLPIHPAVNCWATVERPYGTKMPAAI